MTMHSTSNAISLVDLSFPRSTGRPPPKAGIEDDNAKLIHEPRFAGSFVEGSMNVSELSPGLWGATLEMTMLSASAEKTIAVAKSLFEKYPEYLVNNDYRVIFSYERMGLRIPPGAALEETLSGVPGFQRWINLLWTTEYRVGLGAYFQLTSAGPLVHGEGNEIRPTLMFMPTIEGANQDRLIQAVRSRQYVLLQQGVGISAPGKPTIIHTNGGAHYTEHPDFGVVPGGLGFIDLRNWDGESRDFTMADLGKIE
ncbi:MULTISPECIES: hypothetical protein [Pandoraea]|uniref:hypothetical protein n=1 Tax=Pandoraea TaxID=93217 RepID=UPI0003C7441C|nr:MULTISPECIES: hypothetical protein [Pandoraea]AHB08674.1 hypothetical protein U875_21355 [Pandoraea pnomenusa 3kgm]AHB78538.1 hypothetical protein X636_12820 [Pandoraea pnomenusa]